MNDEEKKGTPEEEKKEDNVSKAEARKQKKEERRQAELRKMPLDTMQARKYIVRDKQLAVARAVCFLLATVCIILFGINFWLATRVDVPPYVIEIDPVTGAQNSSAGRVATLNTYVITDALVRNTLSSYIENLRSVTADDGVNQSNIRKVFQFSDGEARVYVERTLSDKDVNPVLRYRDKGETVTVTITNMLKVRESSEQKYRIAWNEKTYSAYNHTLTSEKNYVADVNWAERAATVHQMEFNPLGIFVVSINIAEDRAVK